MDNIENIVSIVIEEAFKLHRKLGPGVLESAYELFLASNLERLGLVVERQKVIPIDCDGRKANEGFRIDLLIEKKLIIELKSVEQIIPVHLKQLLTYLRLMDMQLGLLINFGSRLLRDGIKRVVNNYIPY